MTGHCPGRVPPFGYSRIKAYLQLPWTFRSLSRPSSAISALASTLRSYSLDLASFVIITLLRLLRGDDDFSLFCFVLPVQFSRCGGQCPLPIAAARSFPSVGLRTASRRRRQVLGLRSLSNPQNDTELSFEFIRMPFRSSRLGYLIGLTACACRFAGLPGSPRLYARFRSRSGVRPGIRKTLSSSVSP